MSEYMSFLNIRLYNQDYVILKFNLSGSS